MTRVHRLETSLTNYSKYTQIASGIVISFLLSLTPFVLLLGVKFNLYPAMKVQTRSRGITLLFHQPRP